MDGRVQIRNIWIKPQSVCETQRGGAHEFYVCCSHYQTRGRQCHGLGMFCWRKSWRSVSCSWYSQPTWLSQHGILQRHAIPSGLRLVGRSFVFQQDNDPKTYIKCLQELSDEKGKCRTSQNNDLHGLPGHLISSR